MGAFLIWGGGEIKFWLQISLWQRIEYLVFWVASGALVYFLALSLMGVRLHHFRSQRH
jgi:putative peptidoglycan lipid II flippase